MSTHSIGFYEEISKIITYYHQNRTLFLLLNLFLALTIGMFGNDTGQAHCDVLLAQVLACDWSATALIYRQF